MKLNKNMKISAYLLGICFEINVNTARVEFLSSHTNFRDKPRLIHLNPDWTHFGFPFARACDPLHIYLSNLKHMLAEENSVNAVNRQHGQENLW